MRRVPDSMARLMESTINGAGYVAYRAFAFIARP
jgi:hypothetical protein